jgi:hypothetical protein
MNCSREIEKDARPDGDTSALPSEFTGQDDFVEHSTSQNIPAKPEK